MKLLFCSFAFSALCAATPALADMFAAVSNVAPALLLDGRLFDFRSLRLEESVHGDEDGWLDQDRP